MKETPKTVVIFSGGMDSTTLLYHLHREKHDIFALSVDYGQRHRVELEYARRLANELNVPFEIADLRSITRLISGSSQTDDSVSVPLGHYNSENMKATVVPNRNMIMLAVAAGWAIQLKANHIAYAAHAGDHTIYPDCRAEFADAMSLAIGLADWHQVSLLRPFVAMTKTQIATYGCKLGVPFEQTWSCYVGGTVHCGACGTCIERRESFLEARIQDPTTYGEGAPMLKFEQGKGSTIDWSRTLTGCSMPVHLMRQETQI